MFYKTEGSGWTKAGEVDATSFSNTTGFIWTGAKANTTYAFTVRAIDKNGNYVSSYHDTDPSFLYEPSDEIEETIDNSLAVPKVIGVYSEYLYLFIHCESTLKNNSDCGYECYIAKDKYFTVGLKDTSSDCEWNGRGFVKLGFLYTSGSYYYKVRTYKTVGDKTVYGPWSEVGIAEGVSFKTKLDTPAKYSYDLYFVDNLGANVYSNFKKAIYIKTSNPNLTSIDLTVDGNSIFGNFQMLDGSDFYDDVNYLSIDDYDMTLRKVPGGYLGILNIEDSGNLTVELREVGPDGYVVAKSFKLNVVDSDKEVAKWIDNAIAPSTVSSMNPKEKMDAVVNYILGLKFKYINVVKDESDPDGYSYSSLAATPDMPWFATKQWDSYISPAILAAIAERIGGFEEVHNCYGDYPVGSANWKIWHFKIYVVYNGEKYYYECCPSINTGDIGSVKMINFTSTSSFTRVA